MKRILQSMYVKFITHFLALFVVTMLGTSIFVHVTQFEKIETSLKDTMESRAVQIRKLMMEKQVPLKEAIHYLTTSDMNMIVLRNVDGVSKSERHQLENGEVIVHINPLGDVKVHALFQVNKQYVSMTPNTENNPIQQFFTFQKLMVFTPIMIGTLLIIVAIRRIIKPIRELSNAAKEVANGHFHIQVPVRGNDELAQLSHNFNQMTKELEANEYLHRNFVSNVSHEFKTPITSLKGYARLLKKTNCTEQQRYEYASIIISESERLSQLSSNLLKLSELENHAIVLKKETYSVTDSVRDVLLLLQQQWEEKQLQLQLHMDEVHVIADQELMFQVWLNLLSNAIKFSNEGDFLRIIITEAEEDIIVSIQDAGIGMSNEQQAKIFQRFYKADTSRNTTGTGLGLSIVKKIVELHNGDIQIESEIGKGSIFTVRLPKM